MALRDIVPFRPPVFGIPGTTTYNVSPSATVINAGEFVLKTDGSGGNVVTAFQTNKPVIGTDYIAGLAVTSSNQTTTVSGTIEVMEISPNMIFLANPKVAATWATQTLYDALVGYRVLLDVTSSVTTILAANGAINGCVVRELDITKYPGKVAFSLVAPVISGYK